MGKTRKPVQLDEDYHCRVISLGKLLGKRPGETIKRLIDAGEPIVRRKFAKKQAQ